MKQFYLLCGLALSLGLTSCMGDDDYTQTFSFGVEPINVVTDSEAGTTIASKGTYFFDMKDSSGKLTGSISSTNLILSTSAVGLSVGETEVKSNYWTYLFEKVSGTITGNSTLAMTDGTFMVTSIFNNPQLLELDIDYKAPVRILVAQYKVGEQYTVKTFQTTTFFTGQTTTRFTMGGQLLTNTTKTIPYQLTLDLEKKKANIYIYNARFSGMEQEPPKAQINLNDLDLAFVDGGIVVTGENVIPEVVEGTTTTPYPNYTFGNIEFHTTNNELTECEINYEVIGDYGSYYGNFTGTYLYTPEQ